MEIQLKKHVRVICDLKSWDEVTISQWGPALNGKHTIEDVKFTKESESGFSVKLKGHDHYLDSGWIDKK